MATCMQHARPVWRSWTPFEQLAQSFREQVQRQLPQCNASITAAAKLHRWQQGLDLAAQIWPDSKIPRLLMYWVGFLKLGSSGQFRPAQAFVAPAKRDLFNRFHQLLREGPPMACSLQDSFGLAGCKPEAQIETHFVNLKIPHALNPVLRC